MTGLTRRRAMQGTLALAGTAALGAGFPATAAPRVVELTARRFAYEPSEIHLKVGEPVVVAIRALDFVHGMNLPDLGRRLDLLPGVLTRLELQPTAPGIIEFVCDNFCGEGH